MLLGNALPIIYYKNPNGGSSDEGKFIVKIDTNQRPQLNKTFTLGVDSNFTYDFNVDWGDGSKDFAVNAEIAHTYAADGEYEVKIDGAYPKPVYNGDNIYFLLDIMQWGDVEFESLETSFKSAQYLGNPDGTTSTPGVPLSVVDTPTFSSSFQSNGLNEWCRRCLFTSIPNLDDWELPPSLTSLENCFYDLPWWNDSVASWDVSYVSSFLNMFYLCREFVNGGNDFDSWEVGKNVNGDLNFEAMFFYCDSMVDQKIWKQDCFNAGH